jgi:alkaline phosphatase D
MGRGLGRAAALTTVAALLLASPAIAAKGFSHGVAAGEVTSKSAILWAHANRHGEYELEVARDAQFESVVESEEVEAEKSHSNTVQEKVDDLSPDTRYWYRFHGNGRESDVGQFVTAPRRDSDATIRFAWSGDTDFIPGVGQTEPFWNDGGVLRSILAEDNDFNIHLGDTIYSDSEVPGRTHPVALTVEQKWAKYRINLGNEALRALRGSTGFYSHFDDHEFINDFSPREDVFTVGSGAESAQVEIDGQLLYRRGVKAFRDYAPVSYSERNGLYRTRRWGRNLELFFLDQRSFRSAKADEGDTCTNPISGEADLAPTGPLASRDLFSAIVPSLAAPVAQDCLATINDPNRTFLGKRQLQRFLRAVKRSTARFKLIVNEMPIQQYYALPYDRWEGYEAERQLVLRELQDVKNVVFITTDVHATFVNDARLQTLEPGGPINSGITEIIVGPVATANYGLEIDREIGSPGTGRLLDNVFFESEPPTGVDMTCSILDQFSYGQVEVTSNRLTITPKDINGQPQFDFNDPCGPFVFDFES